MFFFDGSPLKYGFTRSSPLISHASPGRVGPTRCYDARRTRNSARDAGRKNRASKAISTRLCSKSKARPEMGVDRKIPRRRDREDKGSRPLCGADGRRGVGKIARVFAPPERESGAATIVANELQGIRFKRSICRSVARSGRTLQTRRQPNEYKNTYLGLSKASSYQI